MTMVAVKCQYSKLLFLKHMNADKKYHISLEIFKITETILLLCQEKILSIILGKLMVSWYYDVLSSVAFL